MPGLGPVQGAKTTEQEYVLFHGDHTLLGVGDETCDEVLFPL